MADDRPFLTSNFDFDEDEDISDSLSPSDGYFSQSSQVPQNMLVIDDAHHDSSSKAQEAAEESSFPRYRAITPPPDSPQLTRNSMYTPSSSSHNDRSDDEGDFIRLPNDPPPMYEAARADRPLPGPSETAPLVPSSSRTYDTMGTSRSPFPLGPNSGSPQSMADRHGDMYDDEEAAVRMAKPGWFDDRSTGGRFRLFVLKMIVVLFVLFIALVSFAIFQSGGSLSPPQRQDGHTAPMLPVESSLLPPVQSTPTTTYFSPTSLSSPTQATTSAASREPSETPGSSPLPSTTPEPEPSEPDPKYSNIVVRTSGSVFGKYTLEDLLYIRTTSGSIVITVEITDEWNKRSRPSTVDIASTSGHIHLEFVDPSGKPIDHSGYLSQNTSKDGVSLADSASIRPLNSLINSVSGSISGSFLHGNSSTFLSHSGSISGTVYPSSPASLKSYLNTKSESGSTMLTIKDPIQAYTGDAIASESLSNLYAHHTGVGSGSITLVYPGSWSGHLEVTHKGSGSVFTQGPGLIIRKSTDRKVEGSRGVGDGTVTIDQPSSGSVNFRCLSLGEQTWEDSGRGPPDADEPENPTNFRDVVRWIGGMVEDIITALDDDEKQEERVTVDSR